jgi:hypothetical protein
MCGQNTTKSHRWQEGRSEVLHSVKRANRAVFARFVLLIWFCILWISPVWAENFTHGEQLYNDHCDVCHASSTHPGKDQNVKSLSELKKRITTWAEHTGQPWNEQDINDVLYYLNKSYYHFEEQAR